MTVSQDRMCQKVEGGVEHALASRVMGSGRPFVSEPSDDLGRGVQGWAETRGVAHARGPRLLQNDPILTNDICSGASPNYHILRFWEGPGFWGTLKPSTDLSQL